MTMGVRYLNIRNDRDLCTMTMTSHHLMSHRTQTQFLCSDLKTFYGCIMIHFLMILETAMRFSVII